MQGFKPIGTKWNRTMRNEENRMYEEIYEELDNLPEKYDKSLNNSLKILSKTNGELISKFKAGRNLFDKNGSLLPEMTVSSTSIYAPNPNNSATAYRIPIKPNTTYYATGIFWFLEFDIKDEIVQSGHVEYPEKLVTSNTGNSLLIAVRTSVLDRFMLAESSSPINYADHYEPFELTLGDMTVKEVQEAREDLSGSEYPNLNSRLLSDEIKNVVTFNKINVRTGKNLINRYDLIHNFEVNAEGKLVPSDISASTQLLNISPNARYSSTGAVVYTLFDSNLKPTRHGTLLYNEFLNTSNIEVYAIFSPRMTQLARIMVAESETHINADTDYMPYEIEYGGRKPLNITDLEAEAVFISAMNKKAEELGMDSTVYTNSSGLRAGGEGQLSTIDDTFTMMLHALRYKKLMSVWGKKSHVVNIQGVNPRDITVNNTVASSIFENEYLLLGGKTGTIFSPNEYHLVSLVSNGIDVYAAAVFAADSSNDRFEATKQLVDFADKDIPLMQAEFKAGAGAIIKINPNQNLFSDNLHNYIISFSENVQYRPASTIKVMTAMVLLDTVSNLNETFEIRTTDIVGGSGPALSAGDVITFNDALYLLMLPSSNNTAKAIARVIGRKIAKSKNMR